VQYIFISEFLMRCMDCVMPKLSARGRAGGTATVIRSRHLSNNSQVLMSIAISDGIVKMNPIIARINIQNTTRYESRWKSVNRSGGYRIDLTRPPRIVS